MPLKKQSYLCPVQSVNPLASRQDFPTVTLFLPMTSNDKDDSSCGGRYCYEPPPGLEVMSSGHPNKLETVLCLRPQSLLTGLL